MPSAGTCYTHFTIGAAKALAGQDAIQCLATYLPLRPRLVYHTNLHYSLFLQPELTEPVLHPADFSPEGRHRLCAVAIQSLDHVFTICKPT